MSTGQGTARTSYERLLVGLHKEMRAGRGDTPGADELRDQSERFWNQLTDADRDLLDDLSADLYMLEGEEKKDPLAEGETFEDVRRLASEARHAKDWPGVLAALRKLGDGQVPPDMVAGLRAICWRELGFDEGALCFYEFAHELRPSPGREALILRMLQKTGKVNEALRRVEGLEASVDVHSDVLSQAISILELAARDMPSDQARQVHQRLIQLAERLPRSASEGSSKGALSSALLTAGFIADQLNGPGVALEWFDRAVWADRKSDLALTVRGLFTFADDPASALFDFERAVEINTPLVWPYLYLAYYAIVKGRFGDCALYCQDGAEHAAPGPERARLYEWWALATLGLGGAPAEVEALFLMAREDHPSDPTIEKNYRTYRSRSFAAGPSNALKWDMNPGLLFEDAKMNALAQLRNKQARSLLGAGEGHAL